MKQTLQLIAALFLTATLAAQKAAPEPAPVPASAVEAHTASTPVYPMPLYYNDITIESAPTVDQRNVRLSVAFNGWLYAAYSTYDSVSNSGGITTRMSRDNGQNWTTIDNYSVPGVRYVAHDIVVCGTDTNNLVLFLAGVNANTSAGTFVLFIDKYNATTGAFTGSNFNQSNSIRPIYDVALASDYTNPAVNTSPYSVGLLYSTFSPSFDSVCFVGSLDAGATWGVRQVVAVTGSYHRQVSLAYGRSASGSNGRYFAAWEQISSSVSRTGHIFTSRNTSTVDGAWIQKVNLDSLSSGMINLCRDPEIAVQYNNTDNDSASCTAVVLCSRDYTGNGSDYDLLGFYNKRSHYTNFWYRLDIDNSGTNVMQADVSYDPANNNFLATHFDSTNGRLPYYVTGMNLPTPSAWTSISAGYNDMTTNLKAPYPRVEINPAVTQVAHAWTAEGVNGRGVSMFDAEYVIAGVNSTQPRGGNIMNAYPNPANATLNLVYTADGDVVISVYNELGEVIELRDAGTQTGTQQLTFETAAWANGVYFVQLQTGIQKETKRVVIAH